MSAKHQENDTPVKASHLLLVIAVCPVLVPEHCLLGEPPKHEKFVSFHKSSDGVVTLCDLPGPPRAAPPLFKKERNQKEKDQYKSYPPMTAPSAAAGRGQRVLDPGPTLPQKVTGGCPCCLATGQYPQLPKFLESEPTYENKAWDLLSEQDQSL